MFIIHADCDYNGFRFETAKRNLAVIRCMVRYNSSALDVFFMYCLLSLFECMYDVDKVCLMT